MRISHIAVLPVRRNIACFTRALFVVHFKIINMSPSNFVNPEAFFHSLNSRKKRYVTYTPGTAIGLLVAIALPVDVPEENLYFSLNFEANYNLPDNLTQYHQSDIAQTLHGVTRRSTYELLRNQLDGQGYNGEECLLRLICEASNYDIPENGLIDSIFHVIFKPSRSMNESLPERYHRAELTNDCEREYPDCNESLLNLFSEEE